MNPGINELSSYIIIGLPVFLGVIVILLLVLFVKQRRKIKHLHQELDSKDSVLLNTAIIVEETEKIRFSRFLHNELITEISAARSKISDIKKESVDSNVNGMYDNAIGLLDHVIKNIQTTSWHLPSNILRKYGLNEAIRYFASKISDLEKVNSSFQLDESYKDQLREREVILFRIFQELVINIMKHASPTMISVTTDIKENELELIIINDGKGLTQQDVEVILHKEEGPGLQNIRHRITLLGGSIVFHYNNNEQKIVLLIPIHVDV